MYLGFFFFCLTEPRVHIRVSREVLFVICEMRGEIRMHSRNRCFKRYSEEYSEQRTEKRAFLEHLCFMSHEEEAFNDCSEQPVSYDRAPNGVCNYMFKACYSYVFSFYPLIVVLGQNRMFDVIVFYTLCPFLFALYVSKHVKGKFELA